MKQTTPIKLMCLIGLLCLFANTSQAQLSIQTNGYTPYQFKSSDIWSLIITNSSEQEFTAEIYASISTGNGRIVELTSTPIIIKSGVNLYSPSVIRTASLRYYDNNIKGIESNTGSLPPGSYNICFEIKCTNKSCYIETSNGGSDNGSVNCFTHQVESPSPLLLSYPAHMDTIKENRPTMIWIPPMPIGGQPGINYSLNVVKKLDGQSRTDAINRNRSIIALDGISINTQAYPISISELETNSTYVWQVRAYLNEDFIAASEVWEFSLKEEIKKDTIKYYVLNNNSNGVAITSNGVLYIKYREKYTNNTPLSYKVYNSVHQEVYCSASKIDISDNTTSEPIVNLGENKLVFNFNTSGLSPGEYLLEITNIRKEKVTVRVKFI